MFEGNPPNGWADANEPTSADASLDLHGPGCLCSAACVAVATVAGAV